MTCVVGQYAVPGYDALAEKLVCGAQGGAVAVWSPSGLSMNDAAAKLNREILKAIWGGAATLGEAVQEALAAGAAEGVDLYLLRIYNLLGDPATRLGSTGTKTGDDQ